MNPVGTSVFNFDGGSRTVLMSTGPGGLTAHGELGGDIMEVFSYVVGLSVIRFSLSGIVNSWLKDVPCLFQFFSKGLSPAPARKLHENLWYATWHTTSFFLGFWHMRGQTWVRDLLFRFDVEAAVGGYPQSAASMGFQRFYLFEMGFWLSCCLFLGFETKRKDFAQMILHHLSTVILVAFSYLLDFCRTGLLIMIIHDIGDVFLYWAKSAQYRRLRKLADVIFAMFAVIFFFSRLVLLPVALLYPLVVCFLRGDESPGMYVITRYGQRTPLAILISVFVGLIALHCFWGTIIGKMVFRTIHQKDGKTVAENGDPRSDDDSTASNPEVAPAKLKTLKK